MTVTYVELHTKSFYSFGEGASHAHELLAQVHEKRDKLDPTDERPATVRKPDRHSTGAGTR